MTRDEQVKRGTESGGRGGAVSHGRGTPPDDPCLAVVLGDFGRDAAVRFCSVLSHAERSRLAGGLGPDAIFFDEHRRIQLVLSGQLAYVKEPFLRPFRGSGRPLDASILVGFEGGLSPDQVEARLGVLALEAMAAPLRRGVREVLVLLPCNTLAPVSWSLRRRFAHRAGLDALLAEAEEHGVERDTLDLVAGRARIRFPTVPGAVLAEAGRRDARAVLPLGTLDIADVYREAAGRSPHSPEVIAPNGVERDAVLRAIEAAIDGDQRSRERSERALRRVVSRHAGAGVLAVEACTDLDYGVGLDSNAAYARHIVDLVYGR